MIMRLELKSVTGYHSKGGFLIATFGYGAAATRLDAIQAKKLLTL
jgi:hypothetical protein